MQISASILRDRVEKVVPVCGKMSQGLVDIFSHARYRDGVLFGTDGTREVAFKMDIGKIPWAIPASRLFGLLREMPDVMIDLEALESGRIKLAAERFQYNLSGKIANDIGDRMIKDADWSEVIPVDDRLRKDLSVEWSTSRDELRPQLTGVHCRWSGSRVIFDATDGHVLHRRQDDLALETKASCILPKRAAIDMQRLIAKKEGMIALKIDKDEIRAVRLIIDDMEYTALPIEGRYPDVDRLVEEYGAAEYVWDYGFNRESLVKSVRMLYNTSSEPEYCQIYMEPSDGGLRIYLNHDNDPESESEDFVRGDVHICEYHNKLLINPVLLARALNAFDEDGIRLKWAGGRCPVTITGDDDEFVWVMPVSQKS